MLVAITPLNHHIYENLSQPYEAEFAPLTGVKPLIDGTYPLQTSCLESAYQGFLWYEEGLPAGFMVISQKGDWRDVAEFFVLPYKIGTKIVSEVLRHFPGNWQVRQIQGADHAVHFWRSAISDLTSNYSEELIADPEWGQVTRQRFYFS